MSTKTLLFGDASSCWCAVLSCRTSARDPYHMLAVYLTGYEYSRCHDPEPRLRCAFRYVSLSIQSDPVASSSAEDEWRSPGSEDGVLLEVGHATPTTIARILWGALDAELRLYTETANRGGYESLEEIEQSGSEGRACVGDGWREEGDRDQVV